jgi:cysteine desulfurase family protein (TIGR01976 family)
MNRDRFPALREGWARLDGPAGSQVVDSAIEAMADWMRSGSQANHGGQFKQARETDALVESTRAAVATLLGGEPSGVCFGPSFTALTMRFAATVVRALAPGDEIVCTRLDHDSNVRPWVIAAERAGVTVRFAEPEVGTLALPASAVEAVLSERTKWVAVTAASNAIGSVPDLPGIVAAAHRVGARVYVDAVHATPHRRHDLAEIGADVLGCSAYKWFGPHVAMLCARPEILEEFRPDKLNPSPEEAPDRWELGTLPFESLAGVRAAAEYMLELDFDAVQDHEQALLCSALDGLAAMDHVTLYGDAADRAPTLMFTVAGHHPTEVAKYLNEREIAVWDGNYYAWELERVLGLAPHGGIRAGFLHYNDASDTERLLAAVSELAN